MPETIVKEPTKVEVKTVATQQKLANIFKKKGIKMEDKIAQVEALVLSDQSLVDLGFGDDEYRHSVSTSSGNKYLESRIFLRNITPYGFEMISLVYQQEGARALLKSSESEKSVVTNKLDRTYELIYNLRDKKAIVRKNGKELQFSETNLRNIFAGHDNLTLLGKLDIATDSKDMYTVMYDVFGCLGREQSTFLSRFFERFMRLNKAELIFKSGVPLEFAKDFAEDLARTITRNYGWYDNSYESMRAHNINLKETNPIKLLGLSKNTFKLVQMGAVDYDGYRSLAEYTAEIRCKYPDNIDKGTQMITKASNHLLNVYLKALKLDEKYGINKSKDVFLGEGKYILLFEGGVETWEANNFDKNTRSVAYLSRVVHADYMRMLEYCYYQLEVQQGSSMYSAYRRSDLNGINNSTYRDYLSLAHQLSAQRDLYPASLKTQHDILARNMKVISDKETQERFAKYTETWKEWEEIKVRGSKFCMVAPTRLEDLGDEATQMGNCVAGYANSVANGVTNIMFLRHKDMPNKSVVTVEVRDGNLEQAYKKFNQRIEPKHRYFLEKWCKQAEIGCVGKVPVIGGEPL